MQRDTPATERHFDVASLQRHLEIPVQFAGFWTAVCMPFVLVGLLASGAVQHSPLLLVALLALNVAGLVAGRNYSP